MNIHVEFRTSEKKSLPIDAELFDPIVDETFLERFNAKREIRRSDESDGRSSRWRPN